MTTAQPLQQPSPLPAGLLGFRGKILLFAILLAALPLLVSSAWMIAAVRDELKSAVNDNLVFAAEKVIDRIGLTLKPSLLALSLLRDTLDSPSLGVNEKTALLRGGIEGLPDLQALELSATGKASAYLFKWAFKTRLDDAGLLPAEVLSNREIAPMSGDSLNVGEPIYIAPLDTWLLPLSLPVTAPAGPDNQVLTAYVGLDTLLDRLQGDAPADTGGVWLLDAMGEPLFPEIFRPPSPGLAELAATTSQPGEGNVVVTHYEQDDRAPMLAAIGLTKRPAWTVLVAVPEGRAYTTIRRMQGYAATWLGVGLAVAVLGALVLAHRLGQPIRKMAAITDRVALGDFQVRVPEEGRRDEIGTLGRQLNAMIGGLAESHRRLDYLAHRDTLTGLPNRHMVLEYLGRVVAEATRHNDSVALLFLDLDRFKQVNDSLGHAVGDQLLKLAAKRLLGCLHGGAMAARLGGDEFLVVLRQARDHETVAAAANQVLRAFDTPFLLTDFELYVGVSIGISMAPRDGSKVGALIDNADMAMYRAKEQGRGRYWFFDDALKAKAVRQLTLDSQLRQALEKDELAIYYQPIVAAEDGQIRGMEALIRWPNKDGGFVASPAEFIPLAEETGLVVPLGEWVMDTAWRQTRAWHLANLPQVRIAVNISAQQFSRLNFFKRIRQSIEDSGLDPHCVELEVTERVLVEDSKHAVALIGSLKEIGIRFSVDDFGTGYSSLAYLRLFPVDYLKVPQEFVRGIAVNPDDALISGAVIALAKSLGLKVIAEGVETADQLDFLRTRDCDLIQGYFFSRPVPSEKFELLLAQGGRFELPPLPEQGRS